MAVVTIYRDGVQAYIQAAVPPSMDVTSNLSSIGKPSSRSEWSFPQSLYVSISAGVYVGEIEQVISPVKFHTQFSDDYYYRIHVTPQAVDLGNIATRVDTQIVIWNATFDIRTLSSIAPTGADGLNLAGIPIPPTTVFPLATINATLQAMVEGPPIIDALYVFTFDDGENPTLNIIGRRILVFPFPPNWQNQVSETLEWRTDVLRAYDGTEQRRELRVVPRRGLEYDFMAKGDDARLLETLVWAWQTRNFVVPVWTDIGNLSASVSAGSNVIAVDTQNLGFSVGSPVLIYQGTESYEAGVVTELTQSAITLQFPLQSSWDIGTRVYPAMVARMQTQVATQRHTDRLLTGRAVFDTTPDTTDPYLPVAAATTVYDGKEVITVQPNWKSALNNDFSHAFDRIDAGVGKVAWKETERSARITRPFGWLLKNRSDIVAFRAFLARMHGQAKTCWIPSWHDDLTVVGITAAETAALTIEGDDFASYVGVDTSRDRIMVKLVTGEVYYRKIIDMTVVSGNTILGLDANFGRVINPSDVKSVHFLLHCRFATDKIEIPWRTDSVADPQIVFTTVPI